MPTETELTPRDLFEWLKDRRREMAGREVRVDPEEREGLVAIHEELKGMEAACSARTPEERQVMVNRAFPLLVDLLRGSGLFPEGMPRLRGVRAHEPSEQISPSEFFEIFNHVPNQQLEHALADPVTTVQTPKPRRAPRPRSFWSWLLGRRED